MQAHPKELTMQQVRSHTAVCVATRHFVLRGMVLRRKRCRKLAALQ
jgi:hypothetical protein